MKKIRESVQTKNGVRERCGRPLGAPQTIIEKSDGKDETLARRPSPESNATEQTPAKSARATAGVLEELRATLGDVTAINHPRTFKFLRSGNRKLARKVIEEACEVTVEAVKRNKAGIVLESADLLYHLILLWFRSGVEPSQIWEEMQRRADTLGIAEKLPKCSGDKNLSTNLHQ
jgi:phosphoribosyl-ATP pyrophosphohydrolase